MTAPETCSARFTLSAEQEAEARSYGDAHELEPLYPCELDAGHGERHASCVQGSPLGTGTDRELWAFWSDGAGGELLAVEMCDAYTSDEAVLCLLPAGHAGAHKAGDERWELSA